MALAGSFRYGAAVLVAALLGCGPGNAGSGTGGTGGTDTGTTSSSAGGTTTVTSPDGGPTFVPSGFSCSGAKPSLSKDVVAITSTNCSATACHLAMQSGSGVHNQIVGVIAEECPDLRLQVQPGDPEHSYVIHKLTHKNLTGCNPVTTMPLNKPMLSTQDVQTIYDWICEGAPSN